MITKESQSIKTMFHQSQIQIHQWQILLLSTWQSKKMLIMAATIAQLLLELLCREILNLSPSHFHRSWLWFPLKIALAAQTNGMMRVLLRHLMIQAVLPSILTWCCGLVKVKMSLIQFVWILMALIACHNWSSSCLHTRCSLPMIIQARLALALHQTIMVSTNPHLFRVGQHRIMLVL